MDALARASQSQRMAADPDASVFVTANAGSGKTKVLIDRVARLLLREDDPAAFLCITYTKAAAAEMQRRLFERLGGWCVLGDTALEKELFDLVGASGSLPPRFLARARALFAKALETPGGLRIQTIHSFCERLLRRFPLEAGAPPSFEILDEAGADALMAQAWRTAIDSPPVAQALAHLARRLHEEALDQLISSVDAQRRVLRAMLRGGLDSATAQVRDRHSVTQTRAAFLASFIAGTPLDDLGADCNAIFDAKATDIETSEIIRSARAAGDNHEQAFELFSLLAFNKSGDIRKKALLTKKVADGNPALAARLAQEQARCLAAAEALKAIDRADDMAALLTVGDGLLGAYARAKNAIGVLDFEDLIERAEALLTAAGAAPWVLYKLDRGIDHILIDEGQDTSPTQWDVLAPLQGEFFVGAGAVEKPRTVFAVGDPKQSIYSFQGADPERFRTEAQELSKRAATASRSFYAPEMTMSFRSTPEVLQAVDAVFAGVSLAADEADSAAIIRHEAKRAEHHGLVEWWPLAPRPDLPERRAWRDPVDKDRADSAITVMARRVAEEAARWIKQCKLVWDKRGEPRPMRAGDIMALVRTRGPVFDALLKAFKIAGLPVAGADRMILGEDIAVQDMLAFARVALDEGDDYSLACALKSPLIGMDEDALMLLAAKRERGERLIDRLRMSAHNQASALIDSAIAARGLHPHDFLTLLLETPDARGQSGWTRMLGRLGHAARDPLEELLLRALASGRAGPPTLQHFVSEIENDETPVKREMEADLDAVRVMTVHGAKGLEAPVVILADTSRDFELGVQNALLVADRELYWSPNEKSDDAKTSAVRQRRREASRREDLRLLYVAMTRARDRLLICGAERGDQTRNFGRAVGSWHERVETGMRNLDGVQTIETPFGEGLRFGRDAIADVEQSASASERIALPAWCTAPAPPAPPPSAAMTPSQAAARTPSAFAARTEQRRRYRRGRLIHGLLQRLPEVAPAQRRALGLAWLKTRAAEGDDAEALLSEALAVIGNPRFAIAFGPGSRAEAPLVGEVNGYRVSGVIDRLVVTEQEVLVLDFKTDRPAPLDATGIAEPYLLQLALYRAVLAQAFPGRAIRCALLWTEAPILMEAPPEALDQALASLRVS